MLGKPSPLPAEQWGSQDMRTSFKPTMAQRAWLATSVVYQTSGWNRPRYIARRTPVQGLGVFQ